MPKLGAALDFAQLEGKNFRAHQVGSDPAGPVEGQLYYNNVNKTLWYYNGTTWVAATGGTPPDATTTSKGIVQLAGDLTGTAVSPQIAAGVITDAEVAAANKDGAAGTASLRTIGVTGTTAMAGNRTLDSVATPIGSVNFNNQKITSLADPSNPQEGATKNYVDNVAAGLDVKGSCRLTANGNLTLSGTATVIDGFSPVVGDRVLCTGQTTPAQNGIYVVAAGAWSRSTDMDAWTEVPGAYVFVEIGTNFADTGWVCTADQGGTLNTTSITWSQFTGLGDVTAGAGLTKTGNTLDVGAGSGITVAADTVAVATSVARYYSSATHGAGTTIVITQATHGCHADRGLIVQVLDEGTGVQEIPDVTISAAGQVTVTFGASVSANTKRVTIVG